MGSYCLEEGLGFRVLKNMGKHTDMSRAIAARTVSRVWGIWGSSYSNIPKAIFYIRKREYSCRLEQRT